MTSHLYRAEQFHAANLEAVESLVNEIRAAGFEETDLDDLVHTDAESGKVPTEEATSVNNAGLSYQVASILDGNGIEAGGAMIRRELEIEAPKPR